MIAGLPGLAAGDRLRGAMAAALRPPSSVLSMQEWADSMRILPEGAAHPGRWQTARVPQAPELYAAASAGPRVAVVAPTQLLKTELLINGALYYAAHHGHSVLVLTTSDDLKGLTAARISAAIAISPQLSALRTHTPRGRAEFDTDIEMTTGGRIDIRNIHGRGAVISRAARVVLMDEVDEYAGPEYIASAEDRAQSYGSRGRIVMVSTPSVMDASHIWAEYMSGTRERWHVVCPRCGAPQEPATAQLASMPGGAVVYQCIGCGGGLDDSEWQRAIHGGRYIAAPGAPARHRSFHIHGLSNPLKKMSSVAAEYWRLESLHSRARDTKNEFLNFRASRLAEPFDSRIAAEIKPHVVRGMTARYSTEGTLPEGAVVITMAVDTQDDRLEYELAAWGWRDDWGGAMPEEGEHREYLRRWGLRYGKIMGTPTMSSPVWRQLAAIYRPAKNRSPWRWHCDGGEAVPRMMIIDSGGHYTEEVYRFCEGMARRGQQVYAGKGAWRHDQMTRMAHRPRSRTRGRDDGRGADPPLLLLGCTSSKHRIFRTLLAPYSEARPPRWVWPESAEERAAAGYDDAYWRGLCSERRVARPQRAHTGLVTIFEKISKNEKNEPIDLAMMGYEAARWIGERDIRRRAEAMAAAARGGSAA